MRLELFLVHGENIVSVRHLYYINRLLAIRTYSDLGQLGQSVECSMGSRDLQVKVAADYFGCDHLSLDRNILAHYPVIIP